ncbi:MAG: FAD-dependent oxidoreductase, partial [Bacteroidota bacterium]
WSLDLHPADGVFGDKPGCNQWHSKGIYPIPYRCYYSKDIKNLFLAGRIISASHVAFGSSRVMATCAHGAQAVGMAAALAIQKNLKPQDIAQKEHIEELQILLNRHGQSIPHLKQRDSNNKITSASIIANSTLLLSNIPFNGYWKSLQFSTAQLLPLQKDTAYTFKILVKVNAATTLTTQLRKSSKKFNYTPDVVVEEIHFELSEGEHLVEIPFSNTFEEDQYGFLCLMANEHIELKSSQARITGTTSVFNSHNAAVSNYGKQEPPKGIGIDTFEFWIPQRRPEGHNIGLEISPAIDVFRASNLKNGFTRPYLQSNAYVADLNAQATTIDIYWKNVQEIKEIVLFFDTDNDHPMESSLWGHPEDVMPFCIRNFKIKNCGTTLLYTVNDNYQTLRRFTLDEPILTNHLQVILEQADPNVPCSLFEIQCF